MGFLQSYHARRTEHAAPDSRVTPVYHRQPAMQMPAQPERLAVPLFCSLHGDYSLTLAERHGDDLKLLRCEVMPPGGGVMSPPLELGTFRRVDARSWTGCGHCGTRDGLAFGIFSVWFCPCPRCNGLFHCCGNNEGIIRTACGGFTRITAGDTRASIRVEGWRSNVAAQPEPLWPDPPPYHAQPYRLQIAAPPSSTLRIGFRGRQS